MRGAPRALDLSPRRDPSRDAEQPAPNRLAMSDRAGLAHQDEERGLEGIVGVVGVAQLAAGRRSGPSPRGGRPTP